MVQMVKKLSILVFIFGLFIISHAATADPAAMQAQYMTPVGTWQTVSDRSGKPSGVVKIWEQNGVLYGRVLQIYAQDGNHPNDRCIHCGGADYNKPIKGMIVIWNMRYQDGQWRGGEILDPKTGKIYHCEMDLAQGGMELHVRGYIGFALLGRTQIWNRMIPSGPTI